MIPPEFSRQHRLDQIGAGENRVSVRAEPQECAALAKRFGLVAIESLSADYAIRRDATGVVAHGHLSARVMQSCSVTEDRLPATVEEDFALRFLPEPDSEELEEAELSEDECDTVFFSGSAIDLGEAAAETLLLSLDPFPRSPRAAAVLKAAGVVGEDEVAPLGALAGLKDLLGKKS
ncbi:DUF177 domain-containing protein [Sphingomonas sp.]|jgi:uncharacterized metal-binding protein YceD (DUF177 family)|uniref:YceD family protein n=1 Tax=Sphingomonas sp. TaxID=28214 RepID=UPI002EDB6060